MSRHKQKRVLFSDYLDEPVIELGRITYKNSGISLYLPKNIVNTLHLNIEDKSLVIFSVDDYGFFLIKDKELAEALKPKILDLRRGITRFKSHGVL